MKEIVGAIINNKIVTNDINDILKSASDNDCIELLSREHMQFMSACDLGINWDKMANGKTLFFQDDNGSLQWSPLQ